MSELVSETPSSPDWKLTISLNCLAPMFSVRARYQTSPGSRSPDRVLMGTPAVGVKLMLVSTGLPSRTAARLAPLPRWARMTRPWAASAPARRASSPMRNAYDNP